MILYGKVVKLRSVEYDDLEMLRELVNDPWCESMIIGWSFPISKKDQEEWYQAYKCSDKMLRYIIETEKDGAVGLTGLKDIDWKNGSAYGGGMRIAKKELRAKGIATDAYMTLLRYAFYELRLNRINGSAIHYNKASLRVTEKVGFQVEGIQRQAIFKNRVYHDVIMLGILKKDYEKVVSKTGYWDEDKN